MKAAVLVVLVVAIVAVLFYVARSKAEALPSMPDTPTPAPMPEPTLSARPATMPVTTFVLQRTAEEEWRARVMLAAQDFARAADAYSSRRAAAVAAALSPSRTALADVDKARRVAFAAQAIAAAAPMESRAQLMFRLAFATRPTGDGTTVRAWDALGEAVRAPIDFRPELPPVVVQSGIVPLGDLTVIS